MTDPQGNKTKNQYTPLGQISKTVTADNAVWVNSYDMAERMTSTVDPPGKVTAYGYDESGNLLYKEDPLQRKKSYTYDGLGRLSSVRDNESAGIDYHYDASGNRISETQTGGQPYRYSYDSRNRLGAVKTYKYYRNGQVKSISDFNGEVTSFTYDAAARLANDLTPAQVSFCAPLSSNAQLPTSADGTITVADMFTLYKYENWLYTMDLAGAQIKGFLEDSYGNWMNQMTSEKIHLMAFSLDADDKMVMDSRSNLPKPKARYYNYDSAQGINYTVDVSKPVGSRITITTLSDGTAFDMNKTYSVAINSYRAMGGSGLLARGARISSEDLLSMKYVTSATTRDLRYYLTGWFEKNSATPVSTAKDGNWKVISESYAEASEKTNRALLYP